MAVYSDDFNRANGALGSSWVTVLGSVVISSNKAISSGSAPNVVKYNQTTGADQWAEADVTHSASVIESICPAVRINASGDFYYLWTANTVNVLEIWKGGTGGYHQVGGTATTPTSFKARLEAQGSTIRAYVNDTVVITGTDTSVTSGLTGILGSNASGATLDNWRGGDLPYPGLAQTWTGSAGTATVTGTSGAWSVSGGPRIWTRSDGTITVTGLSGVWSRPNLSNTWSDTTFTNIMTSPNYSNWFSFGTMAPPDAWDSTTIPGEIKAVPYGGASMAMRITASATTATQYCKISVPNLVARHGLGTHISGSVATERGGYHLRYYDGNTAYFYRNEAFAGQISLTGITAIPGDIEWRVSGMAAEIYVNGVLKGTKNFSGDGAQLLGTSQAFGTDNGATIQAAEGGDYSSAPVAQTWTRSLGSITITGTSDAWGNLGGPKTWGGSPATMSVIGTSIAWSVGSPTGGGPWFDTDFTNMNTSPDYSNYFGFGGLGDAWDTSVPGQIKTAPYGGDGIALRITAPATTLNQFVKITVNSFANNFELATHITSSTAAYRVGYYVSWLPGNTILFYRDTGYAGSATPPTTPAGGGVIEWRVNGMIGSLYVGGSLITTKDFSVNGAQLTGTYQSFGVDQGSPSIILDASGGDFPGPKTWLGTSGSISASGTSGSWTSSGPQIWTPTPSTSSIAMAGTSGLWAYVNPGGVRVGSASAKALRLGTTPVVTAFMGARRVWPPVPQTWSGTPATISVAGSSSNWYLPGMFVFTESFTAGLSHWSPARWRSIGFDSDPAHVRYLDGVPTGVTPVLPPDDIAIYSNRLWIGAGSQNYGDAVMRCDTPFEFAGGGIIEVDVIIGPPASLLGWSYMYITSEPYSVPSHFDYNGAGPPPRNGFQVRFNFDNSLPVLVVSNNFAETMITATGNTGAITSRTNLTTVRLEFTLTHIDIYANGVLWGSANWSLPSFTQGYVYIGSHNHASIKYGDVPSINTVYGGVRFDGALRTASKVSRVADANVRHDSFEGHAGVLGMDVGWSLPTPVLTLPSVAAGVTSATLVMSSWNDMRLPPTTTLSYQLNNAPVRSFVFDPVMGAYPPGGTGGSYAGSRLVSVPVVLSDLRVGNNTIVVSGSGDMGFAPFVANVQLVYYT